METVDPLVIELIESWPTIPAFVRNGTLDVLAANRLAEAVSPSFRSGVNLARFTFFDLLGAEHRTHDPEASSYVVAMLRALAERAPETKDLRSLVGELSAQSDAFSHTWAHDARPEEFETPAMIDNALVGQLELVFQQLELPGDAGQMLVVAQYEPGSITEDRMFALAAQLEH